ncbi:VOC family protein [Variovorax boronicumulans]|uniref:VOC family protein n=1 Tax=Variovorax boronicumulans TaxID=436515 RepID=UPI00085C0E03|nr:VOC family protein [Variovorax boronicumulans]OEZ27532.1 metapyrocatechase [Variovorax boronicumulans]
MSQASHASVHSVDRFVFSVPDLHEAEQFYSAFGLDVRREDNHLALYTFGHPHCWARVHASGRPKQLEYVRYGVHAHQLDALRERVVTAGILTQPHPLGNAEGVWLRNPDGTHLQLVVAPKVSPSHKSRPVVTPPVAPGHGAAPARSRALQVRPRYLSHVLFFTPDVPRMIRFSQEILGLRLSDHSGDLIAFLHGAHGSDHHLVAFAKSHAAGLHHSSWDVGSIDEVGRGSEQMRNAGHGRGWGVGRHVLGSNYFYYVRDPWGSYAEYSHDIDYVPADSEWPAADHPPEDSLYVWGPSLPPDFITNLEQPA